MTDYQTIAQAEISIVTLTQIVQNFDEEVFHLVLL